MIFTAIGFGGNGAMLLPGLVTTLGNFPEIRGMVTGLMKSVFFLCASLYTEVSTAEHCRLNCACGCWIVADQRPLFRAPRAVVPAAGRAS